MIQLIGTILLLIPCVVSDFIQNRIPIWYVAVAGTVGAILNICLGDLSIWSAVGGILLGGGFLLISLVSKEAMGYGDCVLISGVGAWSGFAFTAFAVVVSMLLAGITGLIIQLIRKRRRLRIPYAPFLGAVCLAGGILLQVGT